MMQFRLSLWCDKKKGRGILDFWGLFYVMIGYRHQIFMHVSLFMELLKHKGLTNEVVVNFMRFYWTCIRNFCSSEPFAIRI